MRLASGSVTVLVLLIAAITAFPSSDDASDVVPEGFVMVAAGAPANAATLSHLYGQMEVRQMAEVSLLEAETSEQNEAQTTASVAFSEARAAINLLQTTGKSVDDCRSLAKATLKQIEDNVKADQVILATVDLGAGCAKGSGSGSGSGTGSGQSPNSEHSHKVREAKEALEKIDDHKFHLKFHGKLDALTHCTADKRFCWDEAMQERFAAQTKAAEDAKNKLEKAVREKEASEKKAPKMSPGGNKEGDGLTKAARTVLQCQCKAKAHLRKELDIINNSKVVATTKLAYTRAKRMLCVIDGVTNKNCAVNKFPTVKKPKLPEAVANANCEELVKS